MVFSIRTRNALFVDYILCVGHVSYQGKSTFTLPATPPKRSCQVSSITSLAQSWCCCWTAIVSSTGNHTMSSLIPSSITSLRIWPSKFWAKIPQPLKSCSFGNLFNAPACMFSITWLLIPSSLRLDFLINQYPAIHIYRQNQQPPNNACPDDITYFN